MRLLRSLFFYLTAVLGFFIGTALTILIALPARPEKKIKIFQNSALAWARLLAFISGVPVQIEGLENLNKNEPVVIVSNHQGAADILILLAYLPVYFRFVIKKELFKVPFFGWYLKKAGYIAVDRGVGEKAHRLFSEAEDALKTGDSVLVFPEGTRSRDGKLQPFKRGSLLLAFKAKVKVVPVAVSGSFHILPAKSIFYNIVPVKVRIGKPISLEKYGSAYEKALEDIHGVIQQML
ncbi:1-acyl-sn-glycerol-3-phosphate acyltransferase [Candidatus Saganbacteria bacterium]|nr:1-acyl-sn-glycerol-3-phosphate acyltransferase [Candidatus Saganbacteria bacterium]